VEGIPVTVDDLLEMARSGDHGAFVQLVTHHERELHVHCYRMLGSVADADDALQETLVGAWLGLAGFEGRSSLRTWLYRIATNLCLNMRRSRERRPTTPLPPEVQPPLPSRLSEVTWLEPYPDVRLDWSRDRRSDPATHAESREAISLAFMTAIQLLPPRQRAVLILRDVLEYPAREVAAILDTTEQSVHSLLKRARASVSSHLETEGSSLVDPGAPEVRILVERLTAAFAAGDVDQLVDLMTDDVWVRMPPLPLEYQGRALAREFFTRVAFREDRRSRMVETSANGQPALGVYVMDPVAGIAHAMGLLVVGVRDGRVCSLTRFEVGVLPGFGLPRSL
jgi:RNA polymerase sigma-70 factor, ECF subfamily